ncbi:MAG: sulfur modification protein DndD [Mucilaginibacter sp.]|nr:sulfur modification protein DndD [Mucilaginibacter sp.]
MIIESIVLNNFGLYKGETTVKLEPDNLVNRNITVISGQNGVGKSTLQEAIHFCLLGSLSIDTRVSEATYERYLLKRSYRGSGIELQESSIELNFEFIKSGAPVKYKVKRFWMNDHDNPNEDLHIEENGKPLNELNKKEKNLFLRELVQPGLAKVMFFDGERLLSLYDQGNLANFIAESCRYLFGLNFVDLLSTDLNYYINKLQSQQDPSQSLAEINKVKNELRDIQNITVAIEAEKTELIESINSLKQSAVQNERLISDQGRWATSTLEILKAEKLQLERDTIILKKELVDIYTATGPFVFCKKLLIRLKNRLLNEREIEKWQHASDLFNYKVSELEQKFNDPQFFNALNIDNELSGKIFNALKESLISTPYKSDGENIIYHEMADSDRSHLLSWIEEVINGISTTIVTKSESIVVKDDRLKIINKELSSFSKDDVVLPLLKDLQEVTRNIGASEQKLESLNRKSDETNKRKNFYSARLISLEEKMIKDSTVDDRLKLSSRTKLVLESYASQLMAKKLLQLKHNVLEKFNLLCRKDSYLDDLVIDPESFEIKLSRKDMVVDHNHLSAGEKQLLIVSILWGLRELTNISLPLIIDTPLARLDLEHRKTFIERFLPAIQPQVILIGTDMELAGDVIAGLEHHIAHHYELSYNSETQSTNLSKIERIYKEEKLHEV